MSENEGSNQLQGKIPFDKESDSSIISNLILQNSLVFVVLIVFLLVRPFVGWLYYPNPRGRPNHPCYGYNGYFNWLIPLIWTSDTVLLSLVGLDAFMMIQTLKLMLKTITVLLILFFPILSYIYWNYSGTSINNYDQYFIKLSIGNLDPKSNTYIFIPIFLYLMSFIIYYFVFIYYKKYTILRQLYLRNPSTMSSIITLKKLSKTLGTPEKAIDYLGLSNRTVLVTNIPHFVRTDDDLRDFFNYLGVGEIEDTIIIHDTVYLQELYNLKNEYIENIEKEINKAVISMNKWSKKHPDECAESFNNFTKTLLKTLEKHSKHEQVPVSEKVSLFKEFINTEDSFKTKYKDSTYAIDFFMAELTAIYQKIHDEKENIKELYTRVEDVDIAEEIARSNSLFIPHASGNVDFFSISQIINYSKNKDFLSLDLPFKTRKGFVIFKNFTDANTVKVSQLGSRIFSVTAEAAPAPNDIIWENITKGVISNQLYKLFGDIAFFIFNITFTVIVLYVISILDIKKYNPEGFVMKLFAKYSFLRSAYEGFLSPLVYALLLFFVPTFITILVNLEGIHSHSMFQRIMMEKYVYFLFFNALFSVIFASTFISQIRDVYNETTSPSDFLKDFGVKILKSSVFFFNTIVQKGFFGTAIFLLKPPRLITNYLLVRFLPAKTEREKEQAKYCPSFNFGALFPAILIVFPMTLVYAIIAPSILIPGFFFFLFNLYAFKYEFLFATRTDYESGGVFWETSAKIIIYSVLVFQVATGVRMFSDGRMISSLFVIPLLWISWSYKNTINKLFQKSCNSYPLNIKEEQYLDEFTQKLSIDRLELLNSWQEEEEKVVIDKLNLSDLGYVDTDEIGRVTYYRDPTTASSISDFILPVRFFGLIELLRKMDANNLFGYKDGERKSKS